MPGQETILAVAEIFLDAIASLQILYIQVRTSQSANYLLGQDSRPFRQVQVVKKANIANMALTALMAVQQ